MTALIITAAGAIVYLVIGFGLAVIADAKKPSTRFVWMLLWLFIWLILMALLIRLGLLSAMDFAQAKWARRRSEGSET